MSEINKLVRRLRQAALPDPFDERDVLHASLLQEAADEILKVRTEIYNLRAENEALRQTSRDLALFVQRLSRRLRAARAGTGTPAGDTSLEEQAMKFLKRNGLSMSIEANAVEVTADAKLFHGEG